MSLYDKASLIMTPSGVKTDKLYSNKPYNGNGDFTFDRNSTATRVNKDGYIESVAADVPRLNYSFIDGVVSGCPSLLLEPSSTNLFPYSEAFDNVAWSKEDLTVLPNQVISPDGTLNADLLLANTNNTDHSIYDTTNASTQIFTVFLKAGGYNFAFLGQNNTADTNGVFFDLINGTVSKNSSTLSASIEDYDNGWFRCSLFGSFSTHFRIICPSENGQTFSFSGDGVKGVYSWGAQCESGNLATSYIKSNSGSTTTRLADTANGAGDASTFNDSEGVLFAEISALDNDLTNRAVTISDGSVSNRITMFYTNVSNAIQVKVVVGGSNSLNSFITIPNISSYNKFALKYKTNSFSLFVNGFELITDTSGNTFSDGTLTRLALDRGDGAEDFYGKVKDLRVYNTALTDAELATLTT
jgi:hypothetical protein